ncbi:MAG TPA: hypothetical protein VG369_00660, partial [Humibacter sp.]|nr:hypothetical protein [Humibacter sp.]
ADRIAARAMNPDRPEHVINNQLVSPDDAGGLVRSLDGLRQTRPAALWVDARGSLRATIAVIQKACAH